MLKLILVLSLLSGSAVAAPFNYQPQLDSLETSLQNPDRVDIARRADIALDRMINLAIWKLERTGRTYEAYDLEAEWQGYRGYLYRMVTEKDLGDHAPLSQWLADKYAKLEYWLGPQVMAFLHLDDIKTVNFAIPVVFHTKHIGDDVINAEEYALHFIPFCGVCAYWGTWAACQVGTAGTGWTLICTPAGMAAEYVTVNFVAPRYSDRVWDRFY